MTRQIIKRPFTVGLQSLFPSDLIYSQLHVVLVIHVFSIVCGSYLRRSNVFLCMSSLLVQILLSGGITDEKDDPLEKVALFLDILNSHGGECKLKTSFFLRDFTSKILMR